MHKIKLNFCLILEYLLFLILLDEGFINFIHLDEGSHERFTREWLIILVRYVCKGRPHTEFFALEEMSKALADDRLDVLMSQLKAKDIQ